MRIRIDGTRAEIVDALFRLRLHFAVIGVSRAYPDRARPPTTGASTSPPAESHPHE
ncbi:hypothetical protein [Nonomuraea salmonea]|uniref:hypothetical protein n=1 Tax=Nonomuraea salmonea TaxID=46181 RepID=UPI002FE8DABB